MENRENRDKKMKKMSEKREWTNGTGRTNRKSGEMLNTRARGDQNSGKSGKKNSLCPHFKSCGGCQYLDMPYEKQLEHKKKEVADLLGISQSYISRLEKRIMKRLKKEIVKYE